MHVLKGEDALALQRAVGRPHKPVLRHKVHELLRPLDAAAAVAVGIAQRSRVARRHHGELAVRSNDWPLAIQLALLVPARFAQPAIDRVADDAPALQAAARMILVGLDLVAELARKQIGWKVPRRRAERRA